MTTPVSTHSYVSEMKWDYLINPSPLVSAPRSPLVVGDD